MLYRFKQIYKEVPRCCQHDKTATLYLSRTKVNFNRLFFKCANNLDHDPCSYFQWADQEPNKYTFALNHLSYLPPPPPPLPSLAAELKKKKKRFLNLVKQITSIILPAPKRTLPFKKGPKVPKNKKRKKETTTTTTTVLQGSSIQDPGTPCTPQELQSIEQLLQATFD